MPEIMKLTIAWTCVGVFIATAVITLLALVRVIKLAEARYLNRLFGLLVVEIVALCVTYFAGMLRAPAAVERDISTTATALTERKLHPLIRDYRRCLASDTTVSIERRNGRLAELDRILSEPQ